MKIVNTLSALAVAATFATGAAHAVTLEQGAKPREVPPSSYRGDVYVDSRGCAYARANIGQAVNWVPRLSPGDRNKVVCGLSPTFAAGNPRNARPPAPLAPPSPTQTVAVAAPTAPTAMRPQPTMQTPSGAPAPSNVSRPTAQAPAQTSGSQMALFGNLPTPSPAPAPSNLSANRVAEANTTGAAQRATPTTRRLSVTCPATGESARVQIGGSTVNVDCGGGMTQPRTYAVRHADGNMTQIIARPAAVTMSPPVTAAYGTAAGQYRPATSSSRVRIGGVAPGTGAYGFDRGTTTATVQGNTFTSVQNGRAVGSFIAPPAGTPYEAYLAAKAAANGGQTAVSTTSYAPTRGPTGTVTRQVPAPNYGRMPASNPRVILNGASVPEGYRPAWNDDRLNPQRGPRTAQGDLEMSQVWTNTLPRQLVEQPAVQQQRATTYVTSSKSPTQRQAVAQPQATTGSGYVQVGTFNQRANAQAAANRVAGLGLPGRLAQTANGYTVVLAGPFSGAALTNALSRARGGGFSDAFIR